MSLVQERVSPLESVAGLCDHVAWPRKSMLIYAYMPIGFVLLGIRLVAMFIFYLLSAVAPDVLKVPLYKLQLRVLGIRIHLSASREEIFKHTDGCLVATNHVSIMDTLISLNLPNATIMIGNPISKLDFLNRLIYTSALKLSRVRQWHVLDRRALVAHVQEWRKNQAGTTLYTTPEMTLSNQRGVFKFNSAFMAFDLPVVPLATKVSNPLGMNVNPVNSSSSAIVLRMLMLPRITFHLIYLEKKVRDEGETKDHFAKRVQEAIATALGVPATDWTAADKHAYRKELQVRKAV